MRLKHSKNHDISKATLILTVTVDDDDDDGDDVDDNADHYYWYTDASRSRRQFNLGRLVICGIPECLDNLFAFAFAFELSSH